jgi:CDK-activating kinase assembly factor MAT1
MNKEEADFETLKDYNDYLEQVEEITWNLILKLDVDTTNHRLQRWADAQAAETGGAVRRSAFETDPSQPSATGVVLKKGGTQRQRNAEAAAGNGSASDAQPNANADKDKGFTFRGLKKRVAPPPEPAFDPFAGWEITPAAYALQTDYDADWLTQHKHEVVQRVGGFQWGDFYGRALQEAFGGLTVFVGEEVAERDALGGGAGVGTQKAAAAAAAAVGGGDVRMDDVF